VPEEAWAEYIVRKFESAGIRAGGEAAREIVRLTGGHPQDTMLVCSETHHLLLEAGEKTLSLEAVRPGHERALSALSALFDRMLEELGANPRALEVLSTVAFFVKQCYT
jgi:DNA polymerase III delta subunit